jgi:hypothetical protein
MARPQTELQEILSDLDGVTEAYFQKPGNLTLVPPYIVYELNDEYVSRADDTIYSFMNKYSVTIVVREPDSPIPGMVRDLPFASFDRSFKAGQLYHTVYNLYF